MSFDEIFAPGMRYLQEQKDFEEDDAHHLVAEGDPFLDMLDAGTISIDSLAVRPRAVGEPSEAGPEGSDAEAGAPEGG